MGTPFGALMPIFTRSAPISVTTISMSPPMTRLIAQSADLGALRQQAYREEMKPLRISGAMKVARGLTTLEEVIRIAPPAQDERLV